jgi:hypothetical protein
MAAGSGGEGMRRLPALVVGTAVFAGASTALAAITISLDGGFRPNIAGTKKKPRPVTAYIDFTIAEDTGTQPSPLRKVVADHGVPVVFNGRYFPKCKLARLERGGAAACPRGSLVGRGTATGSARPVVQNPVNADLTLFNGELRNGIPTVLFYVRPEIGAPFTVVDVIKRRPDGVYTDNVEIPPIPTVPGQPNAATTAVHVRTLNVFVKRKVAKRMRGRRVTKTLRLPYIEAPTICKGRWPYTAKFTFESGETKTLTSPQACRKK